MIQHQGQERGKCILAVINYVGFVDGFRVNVPVQINDSFLKNEFGFCE